jgi:hypothetical protein
MTRPERRDAVRRDRFQTGEISVGVGDPPVHCLVHNSSVQGALLQVTSTEGIPELLILRIISKNYSRPCAVVRKTKHMLGVVFLE